MLLKNCELQDSCSQTPNWTFNPSSSAEETNACAEVYSCKFFEVSTQTSGAKAQASQYGAVPRFTSQYVDNETPQCEDKVVQCEYVHRGTQTVLPSAVCLDTGVQTALPNEYLDTTAEAILKCDEGVQTTSPSECFDTAAEAISQCECMDKGVQATSPSEYFDTAAKAISQREFMDEGVQTTSPSEYFDAAAKAISQCEFMDEGVQTTLPCEYLDIAAKECEYVDEGIQTTSPSEYLDRAAKAMDEGVQATSPNEYLDTAARTISQCERMSKEVQTTLLCEHLDKGAQIGSPYDLDSAQAMPQYDKEVYYLGREPQAVPRCEQFDRKVQTTLLFEHSDREPRAVQYLDKGTQYQYVHQKKLEHNRAQAMEQVSLPLVATVQGGESEEICMKCGEGNSREVRKV
jgi:hypothetical protein